MNNFVFHTPTKVVFGKNAENDIANLIAEQGCKKVLVHFGGQSAKKNGLLDKISELLHKQNIDFVTLGGVVPNPRLSLVYEGIALCKKQNIDFILAVGGGSVIDSAKAIGYGAVNAFDVWDLYNGKARTNECLPIGCILTIAAAGSEMSDSSVITNEEGWLKRGYSAQCSRPVFAVMNPELTYSLPPYQTFSGITDIMMHTFERYFGGCDTMEITDAIAESLLRTVITNAKILVDEPTNYAARAEIMWSGSLSHNNLTGLGGGGDWATHQLEHELGGMFDCAHGAGLAALWGSWARYVCKTDCARFARLGKNVFGVDGETVEQSAELAICAVEDFFRSINMPVSISELGYNLTAQMIDELADKCSHFGQRTTGGFVALSKSDMINIYNNAR